MGAWKTLETLVTGPLINYWCVYDKKTLIQICYVVATALMFLYAYYTVELYVTLLNYFTNAQEAHCGYKIMYCNIFIVKRLPFIGRSCGKKAEEKMEYIQKDVVPYFEKLEIFITTLFWKFLSDLCFKTNNKSAVLVITGDELNIHDKSISEYFTNDQDIPGGNTLIISNHRSLFDYVLINHVIMQSKTQDSIRQIYFQIFHKNSPTVNETLFITWKKILKVPSLKILFSILRNHENTGISKKDLLQHFQQSHTRGLHDNLRKTFNYVLFPEVSIITHELKLVQDKLNSMYGIPIFSNLLYPRFRSFTQMIEYFNVLLGLKPKKENNLLVKKEQEILLEYQHEKSTQMFDADNLEIPMLQKHFFDFTITYYKPLIIDNQESLALHQHTVFHNNSHTNNEKSHQIPSCNYELMHITPSLFEMLVLNDRLQNADKMPIIIRLHIQKKDLKQLLSLNEKKLQKWLEDDWKEKDQIIDLFESNIKLVKTKSQ